MQAPAEACHQPGIGRTQAQPASSRRPGRGCDVGHDPLGLARRHPRHHEKPSRLQLLATLSPARVPPAYNRRQGLRADRVPGHYRAALVGYAQGFYSLGFAARPAQHLREYLARRGQHLRRVLFHQPGPRISGGHRPHGAGQHRGLLVIGNRLYLRGTHVEREQHGFHSAGSSSTPGFMIPMGSNESLRARNNSIPSPSSALSQPRLTRPMP